MLRNILNLHIVKEPCAKININKFNYISRTIARRKEIIFNLSANIYALNKYVSSNFYRIIDTLDGSKFHIHIPTSRIYCGK